MERKKVSREAKAAKMQVREEGTLGRRAAARKEAHGKRKVARDEAEHVELVVKQETFLVGIERTAMKTSTPLMKLRM